MKHIKQVSSQPEVLCSVSHGSKGERKFCCLLASASVTFYNKSTYQDTVDDGKLDTEGLCIFGVSLQL